MNFCEFEASLTYNEFQANYGNIVRTFLKSEKKKKDCLQIELCFKVFVVLGIINSNKKLAKYSWKYVLAIDN